MMNMFAKDYAIHLLKMCNGAAIKALDLLDSEAQKDPNVTWNYYLKVKNLLQSHIMGEWDHKA